MAEPSLSVLFVTSNLPRWTGDTKPSFILDLALSLASMGVRVTILAPHSPEAMTAETLGGIRVLRFRYMWPETAEQLVGGGAILVNLRHRPWLWLLVPPYALFLWRVMRRLARSGDFDLVHSHWVVPQGAISALALRGTSIPHVITVHGGDVFALKGRLIERIKRWSFRRASAVITNSSATRREVERLAPGLADLRTIPQGVSERPADPATVDTLRSKLAVKGEPLILFVGRLVAEKGIADLIDAMPAIRSQFPEARLVVVGDGQDREAAEVRARSTKLGSAVEFVGWVQPDHIPSYMAASDVLVAPSLQAVDGWVEAQNLAIGEAFAVSLPVVATRTGGIPDYVSDGSSGLLVDEHSPEQIATAVVRILQQADLASTIGAGGRKVFDHRLSMAVTAQLVRHAYTDLVRGRQGDVIHS